MSLLLLDLLALSKEVNRRPFQEMIGEVECHLSRLSSRLSSLVSCYGW